MRQPTTAAVIWRRRQNRADVRIEGGERSRRACPSRQLERSRCNPAAPPSAPQNDAPGGRTRPGRHVLAHRVGRPDPARLVPDVAPTTNEDRGQSPRQGLALLRLSLPRASCPPLPPSSSGQRSAVLSTSTTRLDPASGRVSPTFTKPSLVRRNGEIGSAAAPAIVDPSRTRKPRRNGAFVRWAVTGSNRRPPACKAGALPAELTARVVHAPNGIRTRAATLKGW